MLERNFYRVSDRINTNPNLNFMQKKMLIGVEHAWLKTEYNGFIGSIQKLYELFDGPEENYEQLQDQVELNFNDLVNQKFIFTKPFRQIDAPDWLFIELNFAKIFNDPYDQNICSNIDFYFEDIVLYSLKWGIISTKRELALKEEPPTALKLNKYIEENYGEKSL